MLLSIRSLLLVAWYGEISNIKPLVILQKRAVRIMTFSSYDANTRCPLFADLKLLKLCDIITFCTACFQMYKYNKGTLPNVFDDFPYENILWNILLNIQ